jgi:hypothetical protein
MLNLQGHKVQTFAHKVRLHSPRRCLLQVGVCLWRGSALMLFLREMRGVIERPLVCDLDARQGSPSKQLSGHGCLPAPNLQPPGLSHGKRRGLSMQVNVQKALSRCYTQPGNRLQGYQLTS